jgi:hypothetical protein
MSDFERKAARFPRGARVTMAGLSADPYPILAGYEFRKPTELWLKWDDGRGSVPIRCFHPCQLGETDE